jgi:hypothetical protein
MTLEFLMALNLMAANPEGVLSSRYAKTAPPLTADPSAAVWKKAPMVVAAQDRFGTALPEARTEIRSLWTATDLYFLFTSQYESLYLRPTAQLDKETYGLWDFDVVEVFIGHDLERINLYKEFEVSPRGEWVDLDIDHGGNNQDAWRWNSGFEFKTKIDESAKVWHCLMKIPFKSIAPAAPRAGAEFRLNLYRIEGGPEPRKYITWQAVQSPSFHTPEKFGRLRLVK